MVIAKYYVNGKITNVSRNGYLNPKQMKKRQF
jgi:hypothetical protein